MLNGSRFRMFFLIVILGLDPRIHSNKASCFLDPRVKVRYRSRSRVTERGVCPMVTRTAGKMFT